MKFSVDARAIPSSIIELYTEPPGYTRLEPQSVTGDPMPGVRACVHDPLWLMLRQWQFGEFAGDDAGQPLSVAMTRTVTPLTASVAGTPSSGTVVAQALDENVLLDPLFEAEPPATPGTRARAEAGALLGVILAEAGLVVSNLARLLPFPPADIAATRRALRTLLEVSPDAAVAAAALEAGIPDWLAGAPAAAIGAAHDWLAWYRDAVSPTQGSEAWVRERMEYRFTVAAGTGPAQKVFATPMHEGGEIDWYGFDTVAGVTLQPPGIAPAPAGPGRVGQLGRGGSRIGGGLFDPGKLRPRRQLPDVYQSIASPLRYGGMPADRLWEFEDATVSFGAMNVQSNDPARLCLIEFATIYGNDWFMAPLDVGAAAFTVIDTLTVTDSFGIKTPIPRASDSGRAGRFRLFEVSQSGSDASIPGILTLPTARKTTEGAPLETVHFLRDETANLGWAIEHRVQDASGLSRSRDDENLAAKAFPPLAPGADLRYILETEMPRNWIPLVPIANAGKQGGFVLRKGTMTEVDESVGRVLAGTKVDFFDEEIPRGGLRVMRVPSLARRPDGSLARWVARRTGEGSGGGSSKLAFDGTVKR